MRPLVVVRTVLLEGRVLGLLGDALGGLAGAGGGGGEQGGQRRRQQGESDRRTHRAGYRGSPHEGSLVDLVDRSTGAGPGKVRRADSDLRFRHPEVRKSLLGAPRVRARRQGRVMGARNRDRRRSTAGRAGRGVGPGADPGARRRLRAARRGAGPGRDRRRGDRQGQGAAGGRPGRDLGRPLDARRPAAPALAADASQRAAQPGPPRQARLPGSGAGGRDGGGQGKRRDPAASASLPGPGLVRSAAGEGRVVARLDVGAGRMRTEASAVAEAAAPAALPAGCRRWPAAAATAARSSTATANLCRNCFRLVQAVGG